MNYKWRYLKWTNIVRGIRMIDLKFLSYIVENGNTQDVRALTQHLLESGLSAEQIVHEGIMPGLQEVGRNFACQKIFIPQMLLAARAAKLGFETIRAWSKPPQPAKNQHKIVLGVVEGDLHDIGKNLVSFAMSSKLIPVIDLGVDVSADQFVQAVASDPTIALVGISALLTPTMSAMKKTVQALHSSPVAGRIKIMVGGAPVTETFAREIGADVYTDNAFTAAEVAKKLLDELDAKQLQYDVCCTKLVDL